MSITFGEAIYETKLLFDQAGDKPGYPLQIAENRLGAQLKTSLNLDNGFTVDTTHKANRLAILNIIGECIVVLEPGKIELHDKGHQRGLSKDHKRNRSLLVDALSMPLDPTSTTHIIVPRLLTSLQNIGIYNL